MTAALVTIIFFLVLYILPLLLFLSAGVRLILGQHRGHFKLLAVMALSVPQIAILLFSGTNESLANWMSYAVILSLAGLVLHIMATRKSAIWSYWIELLSGVMVITLMFSAFGA